jgi:serine/threonine-protein kinase
VLGEKRSEIPYTTGDRELLERLADEMALVHENARLREHVARDQKQAFIPPRDGHESNLLKECPRCGTCYDNSFQSCEKDSSELVQPIPVDRVIDNRYQLDRLIGKGGMGSVYEGTDLRLNRQVAIKLLKGDTFGDRTAQVRFEHEAKISARLSHTNIITVHDYGVLGNAGAFLIMELARGETLRALLKRKGFLEPHAAATLLDQVLNGLKAAHALGVVHRDLKPENIFLDSSSATAHVKILDFGLAKVVYAVAAGSQSLTEPLTAAGTAVGTFGYMAPEQLSGGIIDERTDLFAFGVIVVEMLTGHRPFEGVTYQEVLTKVLHVPYHLPNTSVSSAKLDQVLQGCLAKDPTKRFQSAAEVQAQLIPALSACPSFVVGPGDTDAVTKKYNIQ